MRLAAVSYLPNTFFPFPCNTLVHSSNASNKCWLRESPGSISSGSLLASAVSPLPDPCRTTEVQICLPLSDEAAEGTPRAVKGGFDTEAEREQKYRGVDHRQGMKVILATAALRSNPDL